MKKKDEKMKKTRDEEGKKTSKNYNNFSIACFKTDWLTEWERVIFYIYYSIKPLNQY